MRPVALVDTVLEELELELTLPQDGMVMDLARSVVRMVGRQRLERVLTGVAVSIASGKPVADCLVPAFDDLGAVMGASVVAMFPLDSPPLIRRTGPSDGDLDHRLKFAGRQFDSRGIGAIPSEAEEPGWAALHAPVELSGHRMATLSVVRRAGEPFIREERDIVPRLASLVALAWATERYQHQLAELARLRERELIADALHDRVAQLLYAAQLGIDTVLEMATSEAEAERLVDVRALLTKGDTAIREVIRQIAAPAPPPTLGRRVRLEVEAVEEEFGVAIHTELATDDELSVVPRPVADAVVKIAREGTVNAAKHAGPCRIGLTLRVEQDQLQLVVVDDGLGLRSTPGQRSSHGLSSIGRLVHDLGGTIMLVKSACGFGTRLQATFPL